MSIDGIGSAICASILTAVVGWLLVNRARPHARPRARPIGIDYTNWRGERRKRIVFPIAVRFTSSQWHPTPQWVLYAYDFPPVEPDGTKTIGDEVAAIGKDFPLVNIHEFYDPEAHSG